MLVLFTDTDTDLTLDEARKYGYNMISMPYIVDNKEIKPYVDFEKFDYKSFYNMLRLGVVPRTCGISPEDYINYFEPEFKKGNDILYVHFSSAMSGTFNSMKIAVEELEEKYPNRKLYTIDTKGITILSLIIVKEIGDMYLKGASIEEIMEWSKKEIDHFATYFFADSLKFFQKSGRISNFAAIMGSMIGVKPIIYMDHKGTMTNIGKERGRNSAINRLINEFDKLNDDMYNHRIIIGHADAEVLAYKLGDQLKEKYGENLQIEYVVVNPTAGSHCGPDTVGIAFYAKHK